MNKIDRLLLLSLLAILQGCRAQYEEATTHKPAAPPAPSPPPQPPTTKAPSTTTTPPPPAVRKAAKCPSDVLFVLDSTGSVAHIYDKQRRYILDVASHLDIGALGSHVGLVLYSSKLRQHIVVELDAQPSKEEFLALVAKLPFHGGTTATGAALTLARKALEKKASDRPTLVLVLTDGFSFDDTKAPAEALRAAAGPQEVLAVGDVEHWLKPVLEDIAGGEANVLLGEENKSKVIARLSC